MRGAGIFPAPFAIRCNESEIILETDRRKQVTEEKKEALEAIEARKELICNVADHIWEYAELSLQEFKSAALYCEVLEKEGFLREKGISGIETAFSASYGSGRPVIGLLAEYDALSGLSQTAGCIEEKPLKEGGSGHGCGHNILGAGAMAAAIWSEGLSGTKSDSWYGDSVWLSGRRGRCGQGLYGKRWCLEKSGCGVNLASG